MSIFDLFFGEKEQNTAKKQLADARQEEPLEKRIPLSCRVDESVVLGRKGELISTFQVEGIAFATEDNDDLERYSENFNTFLRSIGSDCLCVHTHRIRRPISMTTSLPSEKEVFAHSVATKYVENVCSQTMMTTELYVTLVERKNKDFSQGTPAAKFARRLKLFKQLVQQFETALDRFSPRLLTDYTIGRKTFSEQMSFYNFLITGCWQKFLVTDSPLYQVVGNANIFFGDDSIEIHSSKKKSFVRILELKDFPNNSHANIMDCLFYPGRSGFYTFVESMSFCMLSKQKGKDALKKQRNQLVSSGDDGISQIAAMDVALDGVATGEYLIGEFSYTCAVHADTLEALNSATEDARARLIDEGFVPHVSQLALPAAYFSQFPANFAYRPRIAKLTSANFAHFAALHNFPAGKQTGNPWGDAVTLLKTPSGQPYFFNFHISPVGKNCEGDKLLGNTIVIGASGTGKTATIMFLLSMLQKFRTEEHKLTTVFFDKDRGAEIGIRALGGGYLTIESGKPTGFNPFQTEATQKNIQFLNRFIRLLLKQDGMPISAIDENIIAQAVNAVMSMKPEHRSLSTLLQNMISGGTQEEMKNSVKTRLLKWTSKGSLGWVFDNPVDTLDFERYPNFGIDGTEFLDNDEVRSPIAFYLMHKMESAIDGRRFAFFMDEFWKWLLDDEFSDFAENKLKTIRKQNGFGVFMTQSPSDVIKSPISASVIGQTATKIFLPNPKADENEYCNQFGLSLAEFHIVKNLGETSRMMLIKQDRSSVLCRLDLSSLKNELKVFSGSTDNILRLEKIIARVGDSPETWLPYFYNEKELSNV